MAERSCSPRRAGLWIQIAFGISLAACSQTQGNDALKDPTVVRQIVIGQSSKDDVKRLLGNPEQIQQAAEGDTWRYSRFSYDASGNQALGLGSMALGMIPGVGAVVGYGAAAASGTGVGGDRSTSTGITVAFDSRGIVRGCDAHFQTSGTGVTGQDAKAPSEPIACSIAKTDPSPAPVAAAPESELFRALAKVNLRAAASRDAKVVGSIAEGALVRATGAKSGDWIEVSTDAGGSVGWVFAKNFRHAG